MSSPAQNLLALTRHLFFGHELPAEISADGLAELAQAHRAQPLLFLSAQTPGVSEEIRKLGSQQQTAYLRHTNEHVFRLKHAIKLADALRDAGIPCICYRGPFSGLKLYGDFATRPFQDVDLIIPAKQTEAAWNIAVEQEGYHLLQPHMPRGFFRRHHIHWAIVKGPSLVDLHWAIEHPYTLYRIDYDALFAQAVEVSAQGHTWTQPCPEHMLILSCLQLTKHEPRALDLAMSADAGDHVMSEHLMWKWLDIALQLQAHGSQLDISAIVTTAKKWRALDALAAGCRGADRLFGVDAGNDLFTQLTDAGANQTPAPYVPETERDGMSSGLGQAIFNLGGFRPGRIADTARYLVPPTDYFAPRRGLARTAARLGHFCRGLGTFSVAGFDLLYTMPVAELRRRRHETSQSRKHRMIARSSSS